MRYNNFVNRNIIRLTKPIKKIKVFMKTSNTIKKKINKLKNKKYLNRNDLNNFKENIDNPINLNSMYYSSLENEFKKLSFFITRFMDAYNSKSNKRYLVMTKYYYIFKLDDQSNYCYSIKYLYGKIFLYFKYYQISRYKILNHIKLKNLKNLTRLFNKPFNYFIYLFLLFLVLIFIPHILIKIINQFNMENLFKNDIFFILQTKTLSFKLLFNNFIKFYLNYILLFIANSWCVFLNLFSFKLLNNKVLIEKTKVIKLSAYSLIGIAFVCSLFITMRLSYNLIKIMTFSNSTNSLYQLLILTLNICVILFFKQFLVFIITVYINLNSYLLSIYINCMKQYYFNKLIKFHAMKLN